MDRLIVKVFGVNRTNLIGWCVAGLLVIGLGICGLLAALDPRFDIGLRADLVLLSTICLLLIGIFGVLLQIYCTLFAEKLERQHDLKAGKRAEE